MIRRIGTALGLAVVLGLAALGSRADEGAKKAAIGETAPAFKLPDASGKEVSLADFKGKIVVLEWANPSCPVWKRHLDAKTMVDLAPKYAEKGVVWLAIDSTNKAHGNFAQNESWRKEKHLPYPMLVDADSAVGKLYDAKTTPHMFVIDADGKLAYEGGIDDDPRGKNGEHVNYVVKALDELLAKKPVSTPKTKPYGCSVKYQ